jgi:hypothetical protein
VAADVAREYRTRDLSLAAYLAERGLAMLDGSRDPMTGHFEFVLDDPEGRAEQLAVEWSGSCCRRHENQVMALKAVAGSRRGGRGR